MSLRLSDGSVAYGTSEERMNVGKRRCQLPACTVRLLFGSCVTSRHPHSSLTPHSVSSRYTRLTEWTNEGTKEPSEWVTWTRRDETATLRSSVSYASLPHPFSFHPAGGLLPERMSKVSGNVVNREPNEAATEGERNLWMVDFIMDFMGFFCYFHNKIHNKSTYKIIKNNKCRKIII